MHDVPFRSSDLAYAGTLLNEGKVRNVLFSEGTYQIEVVDPKLKAIFWPFLQLNDAGKILDCFCTCKAAEKNNTCPHLAAAFLKIFNDKPEPLHIRFRESLWNQLCQIASRRHGYDADVIKRTSSEYTTGSVTGKRLFFLRPLKEEGWKRADEIIFHRSEETEETSLKFSNLPSEELALWREGRPSHNLRFELSFWSDLAKWWMRLQENGKSYKITFSFEKKASEKVPLPQWIMVHFQEVEFGFYISEANWPQLIPSLANVSSPLPVYEYSDQVIQKITYEPASKSLLIEFEPQSPAKKIKEVPIEGMKERIVGDWNYIPEQGFYLRSLDPIFKEKKIPADKIAYVLQRHPKFMQRYLAGTSIHSGGVKAQYQLFFDENENLHIHCYVFKHGDLQTADAACFGPWVYLKNKGFYLLENLLFEGTEKIIPKDQVSHFVGRHRHLLHSYEGFQTHLSNLESQLVFSLSKEGVLRFDTHFEIQEELGEIIDFEEWMYVKGRGFYSKSSGRNGASIKPGMVVLPSEISSFISSHKEELEHVKGFFSHRSPIEKMGINISLNERRQIVVRPEFFFHPPYTSPKVRIFGDYAFVENEGFSEIPAEFRLPAPFTEERIITPSSEPYFIAYELDSLQKFILSIDPRLRKPVLLHLGTNQIKKDKKTRTGEWIVDLAYQTDIGTVDTFEIWRALHEHKRHLFSSAGLIVLKDLRFNWLKSIPKKRWLKKGKQLRLNTLEWLRLSMFEELIEPQGNSKSAIESRKLLDELKNFQAAEEIDLSGLGSHLRPYQEIGMRWLWFLYCRGLSGLLCDEMGLGKTHQAMALLAAAKNLEPSEQSERKYLVVCPTSVIYHWEELLKRFLPKMKVSVFYGTQRSLEHFQSESDLLLTSYGTLRSEKKALGKFDFEIAIFDEIQIAKNTHSQTHKALRSISAKMRLGLTGTPIENRLMELKALLDIVLPNYLPSDAIFREHFINPIEKNQDQEKKNLLSRLIKPFILRRKKSEVLLELPEKTEEIAYCDLSEEQKHLYRNAFLSQKNTLLEELKDEGRPASYVHVFALFSTLKQICDHPSLIHKKYSEYAKHHSGKWELFVELLEETRESNQKLVVFSQYLGMLDIIEAYLKEKGIGFAGIRGSTQNRKAQLDRFRDDPHCEVFIASLQAAGVGIDLVAASVVIHYDRWWNPAKENQATDRVHRIGQSRGVQVFKMVTKETIEEHIHRMIEKKMGLMEGVVGFDEHDQIKGLERQELIELLELLNKDIIES